MLRRQRLDRGHGNDDLIRRIEGPDQVLEVADIDRALPADAAVDHRQQGRRQERPLDASHVHRGHKASDILDHPATERHDAPAAGKAVLTALLDQRTERLELLRLLGRVDEDDRPFQPLELLPEEGVGEDQRPFARGHRVAYRRTGDPHRVPPTGRLDFKQVAHSEIQGRQRRTVP